MRYVSSLISGVGIFCVGSGLSFYHGFVGLTDPSDLPSFYWAYFILGGSLASEGATLLVAFNSIRIGARKSDVSLSEYGKYFVKNYSKYDRKKMLKLFIYF